ncbi:unnamed protein product [Didymodactylos carnosus]|uniref:Uncharacterized protein n=1 Tax=Didymodactylos carnosus TaxID=1234261 RepID=A0A8S2LD99_9BILA|nr:unnamed protein product [Didymodactylos carnosus]CAF3894680.1 unnamed protein product [Didymodactylos carnosus]
MSESSQRVPFREFSTNDVNASLLSQTLFFYDPPKTRSSSSSKTITESIENNHNHSQVLSSLISTQSTSSSKKTKKLVTIDNGSYSSSSLVNSTDSETKLSTSTLTGTAKDIEDQKDRIINSVQDWWTQAIATDSEDVVQTLPTSSSFIMYDGIPDDSFSLSKMIERKEIVIINRSMSTMEEVYAAKAALLQYYERGAIPLISTLMKHGLLQAKENVFRLTHDKMIYYGTLNHNSRITTSTGRSYTTFEDFFFDQTKILKNGNIKLSYIYEQIRYKNKPLHRLLIQYAEMTITSVPGMKMRIINDKELIQNTEKMKEIFKTRGQFQKEFLAQINCWEIGRHIIDF